MALTGAVETVGIVSAGDKRSSDVKAVAETEPSASVRVTLTLNAYSEEVGATHRNAPSTTVASALARTR